MKGKKERKFTKTERKRKEEINYMIRGKERRMKL